MYNIKETAYDVSNYCQKQKVSRLLNGEVY